MKKVMLLAMIALTIGCSDTSEQDRYKYQVVEETGWEKQYTYCDSVARISPFKVVASIDGVQFIVESQNWITVEKNPTYDSTLKKH